MEIENSYEGAVRRLARLSHAGLDLQPSQRDDQEASLRERMRDLEELATLVTEENERLESELASAKEAIARLQEQVTASDRQRLRELVEVAPVPERRPILPYVVALLAAGLVVAATMTLRPWQYAPQAKKLAQTFVRQHVLLPWAMPVDGVPLPVVAAVITPAPAPRAPVAPLPAPVVTAPAPPKKHVVEHHTARHHRHVAKASAAKPVSKDADSLLGL